MTAAALQHRTVLSRLAPLFGAVLAACGGGGGSSSPPPLPAPQSVIEGTAAVGAALSNDRQRAKVRHDLASMLAQRIYALCLGWADVCDQTRCATTW